MIWSTCNGDQYIRPLSGILFRLVESQVQVATLDYVDTLEEQELLEEMLETVKPYYPENSASYHYLLKTPFRYPPLKWGSRFGRTYEPGIFYGALSVETTLAESAYYRFIFWFSMEAEPVKDKIRTEHTLFSVEYEVTRGIQLHLAPFDTHQHELTHLSHYLPCQLVGTAMRESGVEAFEYLSARDPLKGVCVGLFTLNALAQTRPLEMNRWLCEVNAHKVSYKQIDSKTIITFPLELFLLNGKLPMPV